MERKSTILTARVIGFLMTLALSVCMLAGVIWVAGTSAPLMQSQMARYAPPAATGLPAEEYPAMARMITDYLAGRTGDFQYALDGTALFHDYEQQHMADCRTLFELDWTVLTSCGGAALILALSGCLLRKWRALAQGVFAGALLVIVLAGVVGVLGAVDFDRVFILFHQLSFDNGLWLLNPATDLLIRLMPIGFFVSYAAMGLGVWLAALLLTAGIAGAIGLRRRHKR